MMTWYRTGGYPDMKPVEIEKFNDKSVWVDGRRRDRRTSYHCYFPTWEDAKQYRVSVAEAHLESFRRSVASIERELAEINALSPPDPRASSGPGEAL